MDTDLVDELSLACPRGVLHGLFDFSLISYIAIVVDQELYLGAIAGILAYVIIAIVVIIGRKRRETAAVRRAV